MLRPPPESSLFPYTTLFRSRSHDVPTVEARNSSPAKTERASGDWSLNSYPPASVIRPVARPSTTVIRPYPWGTRILEPLVMTFSEPRVFAPRPSLVPCGTAGNSARGRGKQTGIDKESLH